MGATDEPPYVHRRLSEARRAVEAGRHAAALKPLALALARDPACAYAWFLRAGVRTLRGDLDGAAADLEALGRLPASAITRYREFDAPSALRYPSYPGAVDRLLARGRPPAWGFALRAFALREAQRFAEAIGAMERGAAAAPRDAGLRGLLSRVRFVNRFPEKGLADLDAALRLDPSCGWLHAWRGEALRHLGRPAEALKALEKAIALDPGYFRAFAWRGGLRAAAGRPDLALADLDRALSEAPPGEPSLSWIYNERMKARRARGDVAGALEDLNAAHALNTRYGWARPGASDAARAEEELTRFLARRPRHAWARAWRGLTRLEAGRPAEALADLSAARGAWPLVWRGRARLGLGDAPGALRDFTLALRADPRYAPAWGWRGGTRRSRADLTRALELDPILAWAWTWRADLNLAEGLPGDALADADRALALDPSNREAQLIRQRIRASFKYSRITGSVLAASAARSMKARAISVRQR